MPTPPPTEVCLTVDVEFSIAGALSRPGREFPVALPSVLGQDATGREHGLGFLLDQLHQFGLTASFFCETLNALHFGPEPMGTVAKRLVAAGHEVHLHLHPCWLEVEHKKEGTSTPTPDTLHGRPLAEIIAILATGIDLFRRFGLPPPVALRTGGLRVDRTVYQAMQAQGITLASSVGYGLFPPPDLDPPLTGAPRWIEGVLELPILSYRSRLPKLRNHWRLCTLASTSWREMRSLLGQARRIGLSPVVILTHPGEMFKADFRFHTIRPDPLHQDRWRQLCRFLAEHPGEFVATGIGSRRPTPMATVQPVLTAPLPWQVLRLAANWRNDHDRP